MLLTAFNSQKIARGAWAIQIAIALCCMGQPTSAQTSASAGAKTSTIVVDTDDACRFSVDGSDESLVTPDAVTKIKVRPGGHILKCVIEKSPDLVWRQVIETKSGEQSAALISLKALHVQHDQAVPQATAQATPQVASPAVPKAAVQAAPQVAAPVRPPAAVPAAPAVAAMKSEQSNAREKPANAEEKDPERLFAALQGVRWVREDVQYPGQGFLETHYTDVVTFTGLHKDFLSAHITKITRSSADNWQSDFSMKFLVRGPNHFVQDGDTSCIQHLHNGKPDGKLPCSMWANHTPLDLQFTVIDPNHIQVTGGQWFNESKKDFTFVKSPE